jgi:hypothetical protein
MLEKMFRQIWQTIRSSRFYAGQLRNAQTAIAVELEKSH